MKKKFLSKCICIFSIFSFYALISYAQIDTEFWFVAPEVSQNEISYLDRPIRFYISSYDQASVVTMRQPAGGINQVVNVPANSVQIFDVTSWISTVENKPANTILPYGFNITATTPVSVWYEVVSGGGGPADNPEFYVLKGKSALGKKFFIPVQNLLPNHTNYKPVPYSAFDIVATENNTSVTILPSNAIVGHPAGIQFSIKLNQGETYSAVATSFLASGHLSGSLITSDKPIAITVSDDLLDGNMYGGNCADLSGDQIVPVDKVGREYVAINSFLGNNTDYIFVTATQNGTSIVKDGTWIMTINAGETRSIPIGNNLSTYIQTSEDAYIWQVSGAGCELGASLLPSVECSGSSSVLYRRSSDYQLYFNVLVRNGGEGNFLINGSSNIITASMFSPVPATNGAWKVAKVLLPINQFPQNGNILITNSTSKFHLSVLDVNRGWGGGASYGYFTDFTSFFVNASVVEPILCEGDTIKLVSEVGNMSKYTWKGPNNFVSNNAHPIIPGAVVGQSGWYRLTVDTLHCSGNDSVYVSVYPYPDLKILTNDTVICSRWPIQLEASGAANYTWSPSRFLNNPNIANPIATPGTSIVYRVKGSNYPACEREDSIRITLIQPEGLSLGPDTSLCEGDSIKLVTNIDPINTKFRWSNGDTTASLIVSEGGQYWVEVVSEHCGGGVDTVNLLFYPYPELRLLNSDTTICEGKSLTLEAVGAKNYKWFPGDHFSDPNIANPEIFPVKDMVYYVTGSIYPECEITDSIRIAISGYPEIKASAEKDTLECISSGIQLYATGTASYIWGPGEMITNSTSAAPVAFPVETTTFFVKGMNEYGCEAYDSVTIVLIKDAIFFMPNAFSPNGDGLNDFFSPVIYCDFELSNFCIYNRYGELVFKTGQRHAGWDGTYNGTSADMGTYFWYIEGINNNGKRVLKKGDLTLIR